MKLVEPKRVTRPPAEELKVYFEWEELADVADEALADSQESTDVENSQTSANEIADVDELEDVIDESMELDPQVDLPESEDE